MFNIQHEYNVHCYEYEYNAHCYEYKHNNHCYEYEYNSHCCEYEYNAIVMSTSTMPNVMSTRTIPIVMSTSVKTRLSAPVPVLNLVLVSTLDSQYTSEYKYECKPMSTSTDSYAAIRVPVRTHYKYCTINTIWALCIVRYQLGNLRKVSSLFGR